MAFNVFEQWDSDLDMAGYGYGDGDEYGSGDGSGYPLGSGNIQGCGYGHGERDGYVNGEGDLNENGNGYGANILLEDPLDNGIIFGEPWNEDKMQFISKNDLRISEVHPLKEFYVVMRPK